MDKRGGVIARQFLTRNLRPDYAELQWERGFFSGMKFLLDRPDLEAKALERALANNTKEVE